MTEDLTDEQIALAYQGGATLHDLTNVAYGTPGWHVHELVRKGVWERLRREPDSHGYFVHHYGPCTATS